jgi:glycogen synthase
MRVLYWCQQYWPSIGGVEVLAAAFVHDMGRRGFEFTVVTSEANHPLPSEDSHDGVAIYRLPFARALGGPDLPALIDATGAVARLKRRLRPDLVHVQFSDPSALFHLRTRHVHPAPTVVSVHVAPPRTVGPQSLLAALLSMSAWITAPSQAVADDLMALLPAVAPRTSVIHPAMRRPALHPAPLPRTPAVLLCLGRVVADKGFDLALEILPDLMAEFPDIQLVIAGDGAARPDLERQASVLGIDPAVEFTGWISPDAVPALINRATIVLVPSRWREAFGIVALQAAQMGRPVVCTDTGGLPEVVEHRRTGFVVPREDRAALATAVARLLRDPAEARHLGIQARLRATEHFNWDRQLEAYAVLYRRVVGPDGGRASA